MQQPASEYWSIVSRWERHAKNSHPARSFSWAVQFFGDITPLTELRKNIKLDKGYLPVG